MVKNIFISVPVDYLMQERELILGSKLFNLELKIFSNQMDSYTFKDFYDMSNFIKDHNIKVTFHAPFIDLSPGAFDEKIRVVTEDRFIKLLDLAVLFSPLNIVFHPGYNDIIHGQFFQLWRERVSLTWSKVVNYANSLNLKISFENIFEKDMKVLDTLLELVKYDKAGVCLDVGHHNVFSTLPIEEYFKNFNKNIFEIHLHDNDGTFDYHMAVGEGNINFHNIFKFIRKYSPEAILTLEPHDKETLFNSYKNTLRIIDESFNTES